MPGRDGRVQVLHAPAQARHFPRAGAKVLNIVVAMKQVEQQEDEEMNK
jgi:hypothetical protein